MDEEFDVHDHRHRMKLVRDGGDVAVFENRDGLTCPACADPFDRLVVIAAATITVPENDGDPFCLVRRSDDIALFRH